MDYVLDEIRLQNYTIGMLILTNDLKTGNSTIIKKKENMLKGKIELKIKTNVQNIT